ncbi:MAG: hypothetical protein FJ100_07365 [Deltaproteobacteria bacterium]|nr:hypothetical protein [Deltaproteobacteria bacterium]
MKTWLAVAALACLAGVVAPTAALAQVCACKKSPSGACQRWHQDQVPWSLYVGPGKGTLSDNSFEQLAVAAFGVWSKVSCDLCMVLAPDGQSCKSAACDPNPIGVVPIYAGRAAEPRLASSCGGVYCDAAAPGSAQVALIRQSAQWPLGQSVITAPILTVTKKGHIVDADVLVYDDGKSFCLDTCQKHQYPLGGALVQEVGHFLGVGYADHTLSVLAANYNSQRTNLLPALTQDDAKCMCQIYRSSADPADCAPPVERTATECSATSRPARPAQSGLTGAVAALASALVAAFVRRGHHSGRNSAVP